MAVFGLSLQYIHVHEHVECRERKHDTPTIGRTFIRSQGFAKTQFVAAEEPPRIVDVAMLLHSPLQVYCHTDAKKKKQGENVTTQVREGESPS